MNYIRTTSASLVLPFLKQITRSLSTSNKYTLRPNCFTAAPKYTQNSFSLYRIASSSFTTFTMAQQFERVLIIGATGTIGTHILASFRDSIGLFKRLAILTSHSTFSNKNHFMKDLQADGVEVIVGDIQNAREMKEIFHGFDCIVSALGRGALHLQPELVEAAASTGKKIRFYPSEYGTDIRYNSTTSPNEIPHQNKLKVRSQIEEFAKDGKITFTYIVTGPFADTFIELRGLAGIMPDHKSYRIIGPEDASKQEKISGTTYSDTARYVLSSVLTPEASENATLRVSSFTAKPNELRAACEKVLKTNLETSYVDLDEFRGLEKRKHEEKDPGAVLYTLARIWYEGGSDFSRKPKALYLVDGKEVEDRAKEEQLFKDVPVRPLEEVVKEVLVPGKPKGDD